MNLMDIFGLVTGILVFAVFIFIVIIYQVYWIEKRNLVVGFTSLIIGSAFFLCLGINGLFNLYVEIANGGVSFSDFSNILAFIFPLAVSLLMTGLGIYGLISTYLNLQRIFVVLKRPKKRVAKQKNQKSPKHTLS